MNIINRILNLNEFKDKPPVLIDIGASGEIHKKWKKIAPYSVCIAFDADEREMGYITKESAGFRKLIIYNCIITNNDHGEADFYLTKSPYCSSLLHPDNESLEVWAFSDKFRVESKVKLKSRSLNQVLLEQKIDYIDWFKTDSQGTDLRLFKNIPENIRTNILTAEFEPGIIDAYLDEDKLYSVLSFMNGEQFWLSDLIIKGSQRISNTVLNELSGRSLTKKLYSYSHKNSPGWGEMMYMNTFKNISGKRELLLAWIFAVINRQYGFALEIVNKALSKYEDDIFVEMKRYTTSRARLNVLKLKFLPAVLKSYFK